MKVLDRILIVVSSMVVSVILMLIVIKSDSNAETSETVATCIHQVATDRVGNSKIESRFVADDVGHCVIQNYLDYDSFYAEYYNVNATWEDCLYYANKFFGVDELQLRVALGWTVNECYVWYDLYLAYLCANCPWSYIGDCYYMADGLAGDDNSGTYDAYRLIDLSYCASQEELNILYLAILHPYYGVFGCDGLSWYNDAYCIYDSWCSDYNICVWSY